MFGGAVFGQGGDPRPITQTVPIMSIDNQNRLVVVGDLANHALRVNVVAGSGSGPFGTIGQAFPATVVPAGARDASGFTASLTVTNAGRLNVTCDNCSSSAATFGAAFPANGGAIGFRDGGGMLASATVDNAGNQFVIASQGSSNWTVTATGTITAHQGDTWTVNCANCTGASLTGTNVAASYPTTNLAVGARDPSGFLASLTVSNSNALNVTCDNCNSVVVTASALPTGASTDVSVQNVEQAVRDPQALYGSAFPAYGVAGGYRSPGGFMATASITNNNALLVETVFPDLTDVPVKVGDIANNALRVNIVAIGGAATIGTSNAMFAQPFPPDGTAVGFRDPAGQMASASVTNNNALLVETYVAGLTDARIRPGDAINNAMRVNVVAGSAGGPSGTIGSAFPSNVAPAGVRDAGGFLASLTVTNLGRLNVTCDNCGGGSTFANAFPSTGVAIGFRDGAGFLASASVDNAGNQFVIASQSGTWNVNATGTITAHQGDTWTVGLSAGATVIATGTISAHQADTWTVSLATGTNVGVTGQVATGSQASGNPVRVSGVAQTTGRALTDGQVGDLSLTTTSSLRVREDATAATGSIAPSVVSMIGGTGQSANPSRIIACDNFASISISNNTTTRIVTGSATQTIYICSINLVVSSATAVNVIEGADTFCNTNVQGVFGGTATASGWNLATNGGLTQGTGVGMIGKTANAGNHLCIQNSTAATIAGGMTWTKF
jgi:hypothetical protein